MKNKIYVGNLAPMVDEAHLREYFLKYGEINIVEVVYDRQTSRSRGFGFVTFMNAGDADSALVENGNSLENQVLRVSLAQERQPA